MTTMNDILTELDERWDDAEQGTPAPGDIVIEKSLGTGYAIFDWLGRMDPPVHGRLRVLERAKPKRPHAVMAGMLDRGDDELREPFIEREDGQWESIGALGSVDTLIDPVPLVEMPGREELEGALVRGYDAWAQDFGTECGSNAYRADAVLELLKGH